MNQFTERYKLKSNSELIRIIQNSSEYQEIALEAARIELSNRGISENEISESQDIVSIQEENNNISTSIIEKIKSWLHLYSFEDYVIFSISFLLALGSFISLSFGWTLLKYSGIDIDTIDVTFVILLLMMVIPPTSTVLFWKRDKFGWILVAILITYSLLDAFYKFLNPYNLYDDKEVLVKLGHSVFLGLLLFLICKSKIRDKYKISNNVMTHVIGWTIASIVIIYLFMVN